MDTEVSDLVAVSGDSCLTCASLGAMIAFSGLERCAKILHGGPGCAGQIRRTIARHFHEPIDIHSTSLSDAAAIHGGSANLSEALTKVTNDTQPSIIGICTTCLTETIGDDIDFLSWKSNADIRNSPAIRVHTPSYRDNHLTGFHNAVRAIVEQVVPIDGSGSVKRGVTILPGLVSPADLRHLKELIAVFGVECTLLPDYSDTLDTPVSREVREFPAGGTSLSQIRAISSRVATIEFRSPDRTGKSAGNLIEEKFGVPNYQLTAPVGVQGTDRFLDVLSTITATPVPDYVMKQRGRLVDSLIQTRHIAAGKRVAIAGCGDMKIGLASLVSEMGCVPIICDDVNSACGAKEALDIYRPKWEFIQMDLRSSVPVPTDSIRADLIIGNSAHREWAKNIGVPLMRVGFPIHDRFGGERRLHVGYEGAQRMLDEIGNTLLKI